MVITEADPGSQKWAKKGGYNGLWTCIELTYLNNSTACKSQIIDDDRSMWQILLYRTKHPFSLNEMILWETSDYHRPVKQLGWIHIYQIWGVGS